ncbi:MAG: sodium-translocating pyrophosphatase [Chloroflexota bacterium]
MDLMWLVPVSGLIAVLFAGYLARDVLGRDKGTPEMQDVAARIFEGAMAFLDRQYRAIALYAVVAAVAIGLLLGVIEGNSETAFRTGIAFLAGAACSALSGFIGMYIAVNANLRTAAAAQHSLTEAIKVSMRGGAVSGFLVVALSLLGVWGIFLAFGGASNPAQAPFLIVGFGFGASFVAMFAQLGGGIYTKAADVGADLVGKVEAGIPEDDARNAAVIADLVGDNVGDCAGRGADLFESTAAENIGAMILGVAIFAVTQNPSWILFPLVIRSVGLLASIAGVMMVGAREVTNPMRALDMGYWVMTVLCAIGITIVTMIMLDSWWLVAAGIIGLATSVAFVYITQYYTAGSWRPVQEIARSAKTGPATVIISGMAVGMESTAVTTVVISLALAGSYFCGSQVILNGAALPHGGLFGTAVATMGMLTTVAYILAMDTFGPITDNAGGIAEMSGAPEHTRQITDELDAVGNTTKALTKGYAVASAALAAFLLFSAYLDEVSRILIQRGRPAFESVDLAKLPVFLGGFLGAMLVFVFSALAIRAVGKAAGDIIEEVRRQFKADPGIMAGTSRPDYRQCVDITTKAALREMRFPGALAVAVPVAIGLILGHEAAAGMLMVGTIVGILMATVFNNSGGTWDNAKKYIESGNLRGDNGEVLGKRTDAHAAAVVGDTVGDPFKDTAGPSLHVLIKLLATITLVLAPLFIR